MSMWRREKFLEAERERVGGDGHYVAYKTIILLCIFLIFIKRKLIHFQSCVMFTIKCMSICNDEMNYCEII